MKNIRIIATILLLGPLVGLVGVVAGMKASFVDLAKAAEGVRTAIVHSTL